MRAAIPARVMLAQSRSRAFTDPAESAGNRPARWLVGSPWRVFPSLAPTAQSLAIRGLSLAPHTGLRKMSALFSDDLPAASTDASPSSDPGAAMIQPTLRSPAPRARDPIVLVPPASLSRLQTTGATARKESQR